MQRQVLCYSKDAKEIYYKPDPADLAPKETPKQEESTPSAPAAATPTPAAAAAPTPAPASAGPVESIPDEPVKANLLIHVLVAQN